MYQTNFLKELIIDSFAGGGGASTGIELATGRIVDIAINHDEMAIEMHKRNHPYTKHYKEDVFKVDPLAATQGQPVGLCWLSPDCTHFSRAKGGKPVKKEIRGLAWLAVKWAKAVRPRVIMLENVPEFVTWGPINDEGQPITEKKGETFNEFVNELKGLGYQIEWRVLLASDYGAATDRRRLYLIARCDNKPIIWPEATHGEGEGLKPKHTAAEFIDFNLPSKSIFGREKPLAEKTLRRIARGLDKFTIKSKKPFIIPVKTIDTQPRYALTTAQLVKYYKSGECIEGVDEPLPTITTKDRMSLVENHLCVLRKNMDCKPIDKALPTITSAGGHFAHIKTYLLKYEPGTDVKYWPQVRELLNSHCDYKIADDEILILEIDGTQFFIGDIEMRMLVPKELYGCQGFPKDYIFNFEVNGKMFSKAEQVKKVGNSVCPPVPKALVKANCPELCINKNLETMEELNKAVAL